MKLSDGAVGTAVLKAGTGFGETPALSVALLLALPSTNWQATRPLILRHPYYVVTAHSHVPTTVLFTAGASPYCVAVWPTIYFLSRKSHRDRLTG